MLQAEATVDSGYCDELQCDRSLETDETTAPEDGPVTWTARGDRLVLPCGLTTPLILSEALYLAIAAISYIPSWRFTTR